MITNKLNNFFASDTALNKSSDFPKVVYNAKAKTVYKITDPRKKITENNEHISPKEYNLIDTLSERGIQEEPPITISMLQGRKTPQFHIILSTENLYDAKFRYNFIARLKLLLQDAKNCVFDPIFKKEKPMLLEIFSFLEKAIQNSKEGNEKILYDLEDVIAYELLTSLQTIVNNPNNETNNFLNELENISKIIIEIITVNPHLEAKIKCTNLAKKIFLMIKNVTHEVDIWKVSNTLNRENYFLNNNILSDYVFLFPIIKILSPNDKLLKSFVNEACEVSSKKVDNLMHENIRLEELKRNITSLREKMNTNTESISDLLDEFYHIEKTIHTLKERYTDLEKNTISTSTKTLFLKIKSFLVYVCLKSYIEPNILHYIKKIHHTNIQLSEIINTNIDYFRKINKTVVVHNYYTIEYPQINTFQDKAIRNRHALIYDSTVLYKNILLKTICNELNITDISQIKNIEIELTNIFTFYQHTVTIIKRSKSFLFIYFLQKAVYKTLEHIKNNKYDITKVKIILYAQISINIKNFMCMLALYSINPDNIFNTKFKDLLEVYEIYNQKFIELYD